MSTQDTPEEMSPLARRAGEMQVAGLSGRLAALDEDTRRRDAPPPSDAPADLDISAAQEALQALSADAGQGPGVVERAEALQTLTTVVRQKLEAAGQRELIAQGLRRLEESAFRPAHFPDSGFPAAQVAFDAAFADLQAQARSVLQSRLGLTLMPDQAGAPIDPAWHEVIASESGTDPFRENTVARQEASGWLLGDEVLVRADVVRYACLTGGAPLLPSLDDIRPATSAEGMWGKRADG